MIQPRDLIDCIRSMPPAERAELVELVRAMILASVKGPVVVRESGVEMNSRIRAEMTPEQRAEYDAITLT